MSVPVGVARTRNIGSGSAGPFPFNFVLYDPAHVTVVKTSITGVDAVLLLTTDYSVTIAPDFSSASITLTTPLVGTGVDNGTSEILTITRDPPVQQLTEWPRNDPFPSKTHERAADLAVMMIGRLNEKLGRSLLLPESANFSGLQLPLPEALAFLRWNATEDGLENQFILPTGSLVVSPFMTTVLDDVSAAAARATLAAVGTADVINAAHGGTGLTTSAAAAALYAGLGAGFGTQTDIASAATVDLGSAPSHNVQITGVTTITSFGSSASPATPLYLVKFAGVLTVTHSATLVLPALANYTTAAGDAMLVECVATGDWRVREIMRRNPLPTVQSFLSGSGTCVPTAGTRYWRVRLQAGGGGGNAFVTNNGVNGGDSNFGAWTAIHGNGGTIAGPGGAGGTGGANGTGTLIARLAGGNGGTGVSSSHGGNGGNSPFGGAGVSTAGANAVAAKANTGSGGGAAGSNTGNSGGGGAGEYVEFLVNNPPAAGVAYTVGVAGAGGAAGTFAGGNGAIGVILVEEFP